MANYSYDWTDFPGGETLCPEKLTTRVEDEAGITTDLDSITIHGEAETAVFVFDGTLSGAEETALDALVAGFVCETLAELKARKIEELDEVTMGYAHSRYPAHDLDFYNGLLTDAVATALTNRAAYVGQVLTFLMSISLGYFDVKKEAINAAADEAAVEAVTFSIAECEATFDGTDPLCTIAGAVAIED